MNLLIALVVIAVVFGAVLSVVLTRFLYICQPNEVLVFSGGQRASSGRKVGYRIIKGGAPSACAPGDGRLDGSDQHADRGRRARRLFKGRHPGQRSRHRQRQDRGEQPVLDNAIERFLGVDRARIMAIAKDTLEGNLRGVLATLTPEELNQDKIKFAQSLLVEAEDDLRRLGLELDTLKIQDVSDDVNYLDSIGRKQSAEVQKKALIAEARAKAESAVQSASNRRETELSKIDAAISTARADNAKRLADAQTRSAALVAEAQAQVASQQARAEGDLRGPEGARRAGAPATGRRRARTSACPQGRRRSRRQGRRGSDHRAGARDRRRDDRDRRHLARGRPGRAQRLPHAEGRRPDPHRHEHRQDAEGRAAHGAGRDRRRRCRHRRGNNGTSSGINVPDLTGKLIAAREQIRAATGIDLAAALRGPAKPTPDAGR